jgi:hypothetical protein
VVPVLRPPGPGLCRVRLSFPPPRRWWGTAESAACPDCHGPTTVRTCPHCHSRLPASFGASSGLIAVAGPRGAGKTVYLTVLAHTLMTALRRRFGADVRFASWAEQGNSPSHQIEDLIARGHLSAATRPGRMSQQPVIVEWRSPPTRQLRRTRSSTLSLFDAAGEDFASVSGVEEIRIVTAADGLMLFVDPLNLPGARDLLTSPPDSYARGSEATEVIWRLTEVLRVSGQVAARRRIPIPVAVVLTKMDVFFDVLGPDHPLVRQPEPAPHYDDDAGRATHEYVRSLLHEWGADDLDAHLAHNYQSFRYFVVSSLGATPDHTSNRVNELGIRPFRVDEPFLWLLHRFGVVDGKR